METECYLFIITRYFFTASPSVAANLAGFSIFISNTPNCWDGKLCFDDTSSDLLDTRQEMHFFCNNTLEGRYVTVYNDRNVSVMYPAGYSTNAIWNFAK